MAEIAYWREGGGSLSPKKSRSVRVVRVHVESPGLGFVVLRLKRGGGPIAVRPVRVCVRLDPKVVPGEAR